MKNKKEGQGLNKRIKCIEDRKIFDSMSECAKYYNVAVKTISKWVKDGTKNNKLERTFVFVGFEEKVHVNKTKSHNLGKRLSEEHKAKISESQKLRIRTKKGGNL